MRHVDKWSWSETARECYAINSDCLKCPITKMYGRDKNTGCGVARAIEYLLENEGEPPLKQEYRAYTPFDGIRLGLTNKGNGAKWVLMTGLTNESRKSIQGKDFIKSFCEGY